MKQQTTNNQIINHQHATLLELLDRLLDKGVMVKGEVLLSVADVDLVYLNLGLLLSSVKSVEEAAGPGFIPETRSLPWQTATLANNTYSLPTQTAIPQEPLTKTLPVNPKHTVVSIPSSGENSQSVHNEKETLTRTLSSAIDFGSNQPSSPSNTGRDPDTVGKGLARLVLTLVDLIRQLMEKQAIRRIDSGQLNPVEIENVGNAFFLLNEKMEQLKVTFDLQGEDLNLDLGPLGELL